MAPPPLSPLLVAPVSQLLIVPVTRIHPLILLYSIYSHPLGGSQDRIRSMASILPIAQLFLHIYLQFLTSLLNFTLEYQKLHTGDNHLEI